MSWKHHQQVPEEPQVHVLSLKKHLTAVSPPGGLATPHPLPTSICLYSLKICFNLCPLLSTLIIYRSSKSLLLVPWLLGSLGLDFTNNPPPICQSLLV